MSELAEFGAAAWLPARVRRAQAAEDAAERREARREDAARAEASDAAHDRHLGAYRAAAELRGEHVSAVALATGEDIGRSMTDILADAIAAADHEDARQAARAHREAGLEPEHVEVGRSDGWPYELDRQLRQAEDNHRELVALRARLDYPAAAAAARAKQGEPNPGRAVNPAAVARGWCDENGDITRAEYLPAAACDGCGHVYCECGTAR